MKFEYATLVFDVSTTLVGAKLDHAALQAKLDEYGASGWELVSVFPICRVQGVTHEVTAIFKRRLA